MNPIPKFEHSTEVIFDTEVLRKVVDEQYQNLQKVRQQFAEKTTEMRSAKLKYSGCANTLKSLGEFEKRVPLVITGRTKGSTARIYYDPSITSKPRPIRWAIVPHEGKKFCYFDIKAAEYAWNCMQADDVAQVSAYLRGDDIYSVFDQYFPDWATRDVKKTCLIGNMYGLTPHTAAARLGISKERAEHLLRIVNQKQVAQSKLKNEIYDRCRKTGQYFTRDLRTGEEYSVQPIEGSMNPDLATSTFTQSGLALETRRILIELSERFTGTMLTVFDSVLFEVDVNEPNDSVINLIQSIIKPFRANIGFGMSFNEAYYNAQ